MRRAVVTGLGLSCALGNNRAEVWNNMLLGRCGISEIDLFDTTDYRSHVGGQIKDFEPFIQFSKRELKRMSRCDQIGIVSAREAIMDSGLDLLQEDNTRLSVILGAGAGGMISAEQYRRKQIERPGRLPRPSYLLSFEASVLTDKIGTEFNCRGMRSTVVTACSSSATAIGYAMELIRNNEADIVITGGAESLCEMTFGGFNSLRSVDLEPCRPFDLTRKGLSLGEGGGIMILEELEHAKLRGAQIYSELLGYALSSDAYHMTSPDPSAEGTSNVMRWAINNADLQIDKIDYISAHGTATRQNDIVESKAIHKVFKERAKEIPVSSIKSMTGHCLGAAGAIEAVVLALTIKQEIIPPTVNFTTSDPACDIDCVPNKARKQKVRYALSNSFAFGGNNTSLVMGAYNG